MSRLMSKTLNAVNLKVWSLEIEVENDDDGDWIEL
jgi:hypothetical protein